MATAKIKTVKVQKTIEVEEPTNTIILEISKEEAMALILVLNKVCGDPHASGRYYNDNISAAIHNLDILDENKLSYPRNDLFYKGYTGNIMWQDNSLKQIQKDCK